MALKDRLQWSGLFAGPLIALLVYFLLPETYTDAGKAVVDFSHAGRLTLAVMSWMAVWWLSEAVHISVTALIPIVLFPMIGARNIEEASSAYAHPLVFLVLGGFLIAIALEKWGLDRRIAYSTLKIVGTRPANMIAGVMVVSAFLSAFVSNTATTAMMFPIALSIIELCESDRPEEGMAYQKTAKNFSLCLLLGIAYAASIGGVSTIIGTGPNAFLVGFAAESIAQPYRTEISFVRWLPIGLSITLILLPIVWLMLTRFLFPLNIDRVEGGEKLVQDGLSELGPVSKGEKLTLCIFSLAAFLWTFRPWIKEIKFPTGESFLTPFSGLTDTGVAMLCAILLFIVPVEVSKRNFVLTWADTAKVPWGILILFGGGLSLSDAISANGVTDFIGSQSGYLAGLPPYLLVLLITLTITILTELTSNVATAASLLPVLAALAPGLHIDPYLLIIAATLACSCAFMMPVATPPNAIVFASGKISVSQMVRAGFFLNLIAVVLITVATLLIVPVVFSQPL